MKTAYGMSTCEAFRNMMRRMHVLLAMLLSFSLAIGPALASTDTSKSTVFIAASQFASPDDNLQWDPVWHRWRTRERVLKSSERVGKPWEENSYSQRGVRSGDKFVPCLQGGCLGLGLGAALGFGVGYLITGGAENGLGKAVTRIFGVLGGLIGGTVGAVVGLVSSRDRD